MLNDFTGADMGYCCQNHLVRAEERSLVRDVFSFFLLFFFLAPEESGVLVTGGACTGGVIHVERCELAGLPVRCETNKRMTARQNPSPPSFRVH